MAIGVERIINWSLGISQFISSQVSSVFCNTYILTYLKGMTNEAYLFIQKEKGKGIAKVHEQWMNLQETKTSPYLNIRLWMEQKNNWRMEYFN